MSELGPTITELEPTITEHEPTATERLRALLDERGVEWWAEDDPEEPAYYFVTKWFANGCEQAYEEIPAIRSRSLNAYCVTPEQAIVATLGRGECQKVYLVETSDDLIESWYPFAVYLHREAAEDCAEALRTKSDGVRSFAKVSELKVVDDG